MELAGEGASGADARARAQGKTAFFRSAWASAFDMENQKYNALMTPRGGQAMDTTFPGKRERGSSCRQQSRFARYGEALRGFPVAVSAAGRPLPAFLKLTKSRSEILKEPS